MMTIKLLMQKFGSDSIFIISKARDKWIESNNRVLNDSGFFEKTSFDRDNLRYCPEFADKSRICNKLDINYMIDDEVKVMRFVSAECKDTIPILFIDIPRTKEDLERIELSSNLLQITKWKSIRRYFSKVSSQRS